MVERRGTCETCKNMLDGVGCGKDCDSEYGGWTPKNQKHSDCAECLYEDTAPGDHPCNDCRGCDLTTTKTFFIVKNPIKTETPLSDTQKKIAEICDEVKSILLEKNRKYGDSAINPKRVFSKASPIEQINVRIDDKLSRILSAQDDDTEDAELDLIGYLILKRVAKKVLHDVQ